MAKKKIVQTIEEEFPFPVFTGEEITQYNFLIYGQSGTKKTRLSAQFEKPLFLSCDPGQHGGLTSGREYKPMQVKIDNYASYLNILPKLEEEAGKSFYTLVLDSATYFYRVIMRSVLSLTAREVPRFEDWNLGTERMRSCINKLASLPCDFIMTCTETIVKDERTGTVIGGPNLPGKLVQEAPQGFDIVLHLTSSSGLDEKGGLSVNFQMYSVPEGIFVAKDRFGLLPPVMPTEFSSLSPLWAEK